MSEAIDKTPSQFLQDLIARAVSEINNLSTLRDEIYEQGLKEGYTEKEVTALVRHALNKKGLTKDQVYYMTHKEEVAQANKSSYQQRKSRINAKNDDKNVIEQKSALRPVVVVNQGQTVIEEEKAPDAGFIGENEELPEGKEYWKPDTEPVPQVRDNRDTAIEILQQEIGKLRTELAQALLDKIDKAEESGILKIHRDDAIFAKISRGVAKMGARAIDGIVIIHKDGKITDIRALN